MPLDLRKLLVTIATIGSLGVAGFGAAEDYETAAEASVRPYLAGHPYAAVTVGIVDNEKTHVYGFGRLENNDPKSQPDGKTIYQIGSITKTFTTTMLAEQVLAGSMRLEDAAQKYLPADLLLPKEVDREITLEELATHCSALPRMPQMYGFFLLASGSQEDPYSQFDWNRMAAILKRVWLNRKIGSSYEYSNLGMGLLAQALVTETKSTNYEELVQRQIGEPLGMADTKTLLGKELMARLSQAHFSGGKTTVPWHFASMEGCGALFSTADDLLIYASANLGINKTPLFAAMEFAQQPRAKYRWPGGDMGLGWHEFKYQGIPMIWHNGATGGYSSMLALLPTKKMGIVMLSNSGASIDPCTYVLVDLLFPQSKKPARE